MLQLGLTYFIDLAHNFSDPVGRGGRRFRENQYLSESLSGYYQVIVSIQILLHAFKIFERFSVFNL